MQDKVVQLFFRGSLAKQPCEPDTDYWSFIIIPLITNLGTAEAILRGLDIFLRETPF